MDRLDRLHLISRESVRSAASDLTRIADIGFIWSRIDRPHIPLLSENARTWSRTKTLIRSKQGLREEKLETNFTCPKKHVQSRNQPSTSLQPSATLRPHTPCSHAKECVRPRQTRQDKSPQAPSSDQVHKPDRTRTGQEKFQANKSSQDRQDKTDRQEGMCATKFTSPKFQPSSRAPRQDYVSPWAQKTVCVFCK